MNDIIHGSQDAEELHGARGLDESPGPDLSHASHGSHGSEIAPPLGRAAEPTARGPFVRPIELFLIGGVVSFDQLTKLTVRLMLPLHESRHIIPNLLDFTHVQNTGAAFGLLNAADFPYKSAVMIVIAALALVAISLYARQLATHEQLSRYGLALILGGAFGNLIDRALSGYVVDFVDVYWGDAHFWAFNVADAAITIGAVFVLLEMLGLGRRHAAHQA
jgi:signal peptidase II